MNAETFSRHLCASARYGKPHAHCRGFISDMLGLLGFKHAASAVASNTKFCCSRKNAAFVRSAAVIDLKIQESLSCQPWFFYQRWIAVFLSTPRLVGPQGPAILRKEATLRTVATFAEPIDYWDRLEKGTMKVHEPRVVLNPPK